MPKIAYENTPSGFTEIIYMPSGQTGNVFEVRDTGNALWLAITYTGSISGANLSLGGGGAGTLTARTPITGGGSMTSNIDVGIQAGGTSQNGYISSTDWNTFNNKVATGVQVSGVAPITGGGPLTTNILLGMPAANGSTNGYLTSSDWNTFNSAGGSSFSANGPMMAQIFG